MVELNGAFLADTLGNAAKTTADSAVALLPGLIAAVLVVVIGWLVAFLVGWIFSALMKAIRFESFLKSHKVEDALGTVRISDVLTKIVKYYVFLIFLQAAVSFLALGTITAYLTTVLIYAPALIAAAMVLLLAVLLGEYLKEAIFDLDKKSANVKLAGRGAKLAIIYVGATMALATAGFDTVLITGIFMTVVQAAAFGLALALGIAFGLGGQNDARDVIQGARRSLKV